MCPAVPTMIDFMRVEIIQAFADMTLPAYPPGMPASAALGFKLHTGWAMLVAVAGTPAKFEILLSSRIELLPPGDAIPRFMYHRAAEISLTQATKLIQQAEVAAHDA